MSLVLGYCMILFTLTFVAPFTSNCNHLQTSITFLSRPYSKAYSWTYKVRFGNSDFSLGAAKSHLDHTAKNRHKKGPSGTKEELDNYIKAAKLLNIPQSEIDQYVASFNILRGKKCAKPQVQIVQERKEKHIPKRLTKHAALLPDPKVEYGIDEAIDRIKLISGTRFVEGIDLALNIPLTKTRKKSQAGQFAKLVTLPHQSLKSKRVKIGIFANKDTCDEVQSFQSSKIAFVGGLELIESFIESKEIPEANLVLCDAETFHKLSKIGKALARKRLMPSKAIGTCVETKTDLLEILKAAIERNTSVVRSDTAGDIKCNFADVGMATRDIRENLLELVAFFRNNKPPYASSKFITKASISSSMGPSFRLNLIELGIGKGRRRI
ncbi:bifunctional Ribosomal protein L1-ribosomal biogenesis protein/Ribosomal protein L1-like/Ribosomal protein L1 [Babesia duncani]|uniref:Bifunctional Ribosomal protein L1-ribosomal biogenesis protein/Ribosomal protein L1-like/Ribosomal protein L1 n=1 Tax=Babesia duncani TaxID=323732 RepID=A0AAD9PNK2_9APIC|nr:bifunctional Ribosomal protein L1-ribosomal biogenesis protein/Ribosomal protein L1-like/Ribosomal protein L1 [Babesia duncani]